MVVERQNARGETMCERGRQEAVQITKIYKTVRKAGNGNNLVVVVCGRTVVVSVWWW